MRADPLQEAETDAAPLEVSRPVRWALRLAWAIALATGVVKLVTALGRSPHRPIFFDFHAFMIAGQAASAGHLAGVYDFGAMVRLEQQAGARGGFMPWSYPPLFGLVLAPFSQLPIALAFCLFVVGGFALFFLTLRRLAPGSVWPVLVTLTPCTIVNINVGQNGFLSGALFALAASAFIHRKPGQGGLAIGALAYKPHLAVVWPVLLAARGRWATLAVAGAVASGLTLVSFLAVGPEPFKAFMAASAQTGRFMAAGNYPLQRMTSLYATLRSLGAPPPAALAVHVIGALGAMCGVIWAGRRLAEPAVAGLAIMGGVFLSPYFYDYDLPVFGVGLALVLPELAARTTRLRLILLLVAAGVAQMVGLPMSGWSFRPSFGGLLLMADFGLMLLILARAPRRRANPPTVPGPVAAPAS